MNFCFVDYYMANTLSGEVMGPVNHGFVIIVKHGETVDIGERDAHRDESFIKVA